MGLQPPKPQLAAQSAFLEECEGLLMVTPSLTVLGARSHTALPHFFYLFFFSLTHTQTCSQTNMLTHTNVYILYSMYADRNTYAQAGTESLSL